MATNLFNKEHKAVSDEYRKGYERIRWQSSEDTRRKDDDSEEGSD